MESIPIATSNQDRCTLDTHLHTMSTYLSHPPMSAPRVTLGADIGTSIHSIHLKPNSPIRSKWKARSQLNNQAEARQAGRQTDRGALERNPEWINYPTMEQDRICRGTVHSGCTPQSTQRNASACAIPPRANSIRLVSSIYYYCGYWVPQVEALFHAYSASCVNNNVHSRCYPLSTSTGTRASMYSCT